MQQSHKEPTLKTYNQLIYLVEDDDDDALLFESAFQEVMPQCRIRIFKNGLVMLEIMTDPAQQPQIIFLDLHLPYPDGLEILMNLKINKDWAHIPVIMFTGNKDPQKATLAYQLGAQAVVHKPDRYSHLVDILQTIRQYWFKMAYRPSAEA